MTADKRYITLSQLQREIKDALNKRFGAPMWVVAEIGEMKVNSRSGHCYMQLVEKGGANGVPQAQASAIIWAGQYGMLASCFTATTGEVLKAGMKVLLNVAVTHHELYGLSLRVVDIDPLYTLGDLEQQRLKTIAQLKDDGVFDLNRELCLPEIPQRIAVISSPSAAGYQDFMNELDAYMYRFDVELFEAVMQGHGAEDSIIDALLRISDREDEFDVVVIIRGGGSQSDLSFLNSYMLSFNIAQFPLPVIAGLGHDKDQSVIDMVAAMSLKTPTAVAAFLVDCAAMFDNRLEEVGAAMRNRVSTVLLEREKELNMLGGLIGERAIGALSRHRILVNSLSDIVSVKARQIVSSQGVKMDMVLGILQERVNNIFASETTRISHLEALMDAVDPKTVLARGYAIVRCDGKALADSFRIEEGTIVNITLHKGKLKAKVTENER